MTDKIEFVLFRLNIVSQNLGQGFDHGIAAFKTVMIIKRFEMVYVEIADIKVHFLRKTLFDLPLNEFVSRQPAEGIGPPRQLEAFLGYGVENAHHRNDAEGICHSW